MTGMAETPDEPLVPVFVPALVALLQFAEDQKGSPLTEDEVLEIRDNGSCIALTVPDAAAMAEARGYDDLDPEDCWEQWQQLRAFLEAPSGQDATEQDATG